MEHKAQEKDVFWSVGKKIFCIALSLFLFLQVFPVHRLLQVYTPYHFYTNAEISKLLYIGTNADRCAVAPIMEQANAAFHDWGHTKEENEQRYGLLARYAQYNTTPPPIHQYDLRLWSASLGETKGCMWVYYTDASLDKYLNPISGAWNVPSLWYVEKNAAGQWEVVEINEHP